MRPIRRVKIIAVWAWFFALWMRAVIQMSGKVMRGCIPERWDFLASVQPMINLCSKKRIT
jgi:hypothetical protein